MVHQHEHPDPSSSGESHAPGGSTRADDRNRKRLAFVLALTFSYMVAEFIGGLLSGSLALLADSGHALSDAAALGLSLFALWVARRPATPRRTFGYYRVEILAALANATLLVVISVYIVIEAIERFGAPHGVNGAVMIGVASGGLAMNLIGLVILHGGRADNLNLRGAWLHVLSDALGSVGAVVAGALIWAAGWRWADPVASILIALLVLHSAWSLLTESVAVLMEGTPGHIDLDQVRDALAGTAGVRGVHDLHIWTITSGLESLSGHVVTDGSLPQRSLLSGMQKLLRDRFGIDHVTLQIEPPDFDEGCGTC